MDFPEFDVQEHLRFDNIPTQATGARQIVRRKMLRYGVIQNFG